MTDAMQQRLRAIGPKTMAATLSRFPESVRQQIEARLGLTTAAMASGQGGDDISSAAAQGRAIITCLV
jgi:hypothetical protein